MKFMAYPALNIIGGRRYMKKISSLKTKTCELFHSVFRRITIPVQRPCIQIKPNKKKIIRKFQNNDMLFSKPKLEHLIWRNLQWEGQWLIQSSIDFSPEDDQSQCKNKGAPRIKLWNLWELGRWSSISPPVSSKQRPKGNPSRWSHSISASSC